MSPLPTKQVSRRRALFIGASVVGSALVPAALARSAAPLARWRGIALGAASEILLAGLEQSAARSVFGTVEAEIGRLEAIFSLYRTDSALTRLNQAGEMRNPPPELVELLTLAGAAWRQTGGLFDPTIQPLFSLFAQHFAGSETEPDQQAVREALSLVGFEKIGFDASRVRFERRGMALTFNGIAQGYMTDRITELLRAHGFGNILVDIGEIRALGRGTSGRGWRIGVKRGTASPDIVHRLLVTDRAVATSMMHGTTLDRSGRAGHIIHPHLGLAPRYNERVTVLDASAARADALSTAAILMNERELSSLLRDGIQVLV